MDATRSSLEFPPPAWDRTTDPKRRGARSGGAGFAWMLLTCALVGLLLLAGVTPELRDVLGVVVALGAAGWTVLTVRMLRWRRRAAPAAA